jgi:DNA repair exonuclease SbcCD ATPase subunit/DNA repair exonuclease SbcCD nuclease subunit
LIDSKQNKRYTAIFHSHKWLFGALMSYRVVHIADTHIRNLAYHEEYRSIFSQMYNKIRELNPDFIVHCGDIAHTKTQLSPEYFDLAGEFLKNLADIAPTHILLGNHDFNANNKTRQDAVTPIFQALQHPQLFLHKNSKEYQWDSNLTLNIMSLVDRDSWVDITQPNKINIALYHGSISGVETDTGYIMEHGDLNVDRLLEFDYAFLGDIHKTNQAVDEAGRARYPGSTVQQNFGESNDKGFLFWEIHSKTEYDVTHYPFDNPKPFITTYLDIDGELDPDFEPPDNARIRLVGYRNTPLDKVKKAVDVLKTKHIPISLTYAANGGDVPGNILEEAVSNLNISDLRNPVVQEELIEEFLRPYNPEQSVLKRVYELNKAYNAQALETEDYQRNVKWSLKKLEWDNLFNYGEGNSIDFSNLHGIVGIFGKNYSGKSSVVDSLMWSLQNTTSKNVRKNYDIINQEKPYASAKVTFAVGEKQYTVDRRAEKYTKKHKGALIEEAKTQVNFTSSDVGLSELDGEELNGIDRNETDKNIRSVLGTAEDFLLTTMASQEGSLAFINEGSTRRKEILAKFLDLEIFSKKHKLAADDTVELKANVKKYEARSFDDENMLVRADRTAAEHKSTNLKKCIATSKRKIKQLNKELNDIDVQLREDDITPIDIKKAQADKVDLQAKLLLIDNQSKTIKLEIAKKKEILAKAQQSNQAIDLEKVKKNMTILRSEKDKLDSLLKEFNNLTKELEEHKKKALLLEEVPCGDKYPECKFLKNAVVSKGKINSVQDLVSIKSSNITENKEVIEKLDEEGLQAIKAQFVKLSSEISQAKLDIAKLEADQEKNKYKLSNTKKELQDIDSSITLYNDKQAEMERLVSLREQREAIEYRIEEAERVLEEEEEYLRECYTQLGILEEKSKTIVSQKEEYKKLSEEYSAYDLYSKCMHSNGISYDILRKTLPVINDEISKVLSTVVEFEVYFEDDGKKLDILIKHPNSDPRPIELGSGAEKSLAAMAIRIAMLKNSSLPHGDLVIIDEPATALDEDNISGFAAVLNMLKTQFKTVILISHLDALKDMVDVQITINNIDGFANIVI